MFRKPPSARLPQMDTPLLRGEGGAVSTHSRETNSTRRKPPSPTYPSQPRAWDAPGD